MAKKRSRGNKICVAENCLKISGRSTYCSMHYKRLKTNNSLNLKTVKERFEEKFIKTNGGCWEWTAGLRYYNQRSKSYGSFRANGKTYNSHRFSYELYIGEIPAGLLICHKCDNTICVNPDHLFTGSLKDNMQDMIKKGRQVKSKNGKW